MRNLSHHAQHRLVGCSAIVVIVTVPQDRSNSFQTGMAQICVNFTSNAVFPLTRNFRLSRSKSLSDADVKLKSIV
jgi:hypothetical protein